MAVALARRSLQLTLDSTARGVRAPLTRQRQMVLARHAFCLAGRGFRSAELSVAFVTRAESARLNRMLRKKVAPVDVLSVALPSVVRTDLVGQIVLCPPLIRLRTVGSHRTLADETAYLFVHAVLHLVGHDHQRAGDTRRMERLEDHILQQ